MLFIGDIAQQVRKAVNTDEEPKRCDYESIPTDDHGTAHEHENGFPAEQCGEEMDDVTPFSKRGLLGLKRITLFGSIVCVANNIAGPGMVVLPRVYQEAGWVVPSAVLVLVCITSSLAATFLVDTMARIPGNSRFQRRIEFVNIFDEYWGTTGMRFAQAMFIINMMAQTVSSIVANAQTVAALGASCHEGNVVPFQDLDSQAPLISLGYALLGLMLIPMSNMNLEDNVVIQKVSFFMLLILSAEFLIQFWSQGLDKHDVPAFGTDYSHVVGSILFNYAFITIIPSWLNEKRPEVSVNQTVWISTIGSTALYIATGLMGACAYTHAQGNFLNALSNPCSPLVTRISAFLFAFGIIGLGIPFNCIVTRYSLLVGRTCGPGMSNFWAVYFPWLLSWLFYGGGLFNEVVAWSGDLDIGPINFVLPLAVTLTALGVAPWRWTRGWMVSRDIVCRTVGAGRRYGPLQIAEEDDDSDEVNRPTAVEPLPSFAARFQRPVGTMAAGVLVLGILASVLSHSKTAYDGAFQAIRK